MKTKSILILIATLIIGFVIGFLTNGHLTKRKIQSFVNMGTSAGFKERLYHIIKPDEMQRNEIDPILEKYAVKIHESVVGSHDEMKNINDEMMEELEPFLNEDQVMRMREIHEKMDRGWRKHHPDGHPRQGKGKPGARR